MTADFTRAVAFVLEHEGGLVSDPHDPGLLTKYGISKRAHPNVDIANLTVQDAQGIYRRDYWEPMRCEEMPHSIALIVFDAAVNQGQRAASLMLQTALGVTVDGILGSQTMTALARADERALTVNLAAERGVRYAGTANFYRYGRGWMRRLIAAVVAAREA